jgi:ribonuclease P protein component
VLPRASRLTTSAGFRSTFRAGVRVGRPTLVVHVGKASDRDGVQVGFVVSKAVGGAVTRNRVKRRLRHLAASQLGRTPAGTDVVVRALPRSADPAADLAGDLASAWATAVRRLGSRP